MLLPLRISIHDDEDVRSVASRAALRNNLSEREFARTVLGVKFFDGLGNIAPHSVLERLSGATGYSLERLLSNSLRDYNGAIWVGSNRLSSTNCISGLVRRGRICSACLLEDLDNKNDIPSCRPYRRLSWTFGPFKTCTRHSLILLRNCPCCGKRIDPLALDFVRCDCGFALYNSKHHPLGDELMRAERYLNDRLFTSNQIEQHWLLDKLAPAEAEIALTNIGLSAQSTESSLKISDLDDLARLELLSTGFELVSSYNRFYSFLDYLSSRTIRKKSGLQVVYGRLYRWLYVRANEEYRPLQEIITQHFEQTQKATNSIRIFYKELGRYNFMSVRSAADQCKCSVERFYSCAQFLGFEFEGINCASRSVHIDIVEKVKNLLNTTIDSGEMARRLEISRRVKHAFIHSDFFGVTGYRRFGRPLLDRQKIEQLINLIEGNDKYYEKPPRGHALICRVAHGYGVSVPDIAKQVLMGRVPSIGAVTDRPGLPSMLVDIKAIREVFIETDGLFGQNAFRAAGMTSARQLKCAVEAGIISVSIKRDNKRQNRIFISREEIERFRSTYVLLASLADRDLTLYKQVKCALVSGRMKSMACDGRFSIIRRSDIKGLDCTS